VLTAEQDIYSEEWKPGWVMIFRIYSRMEHVYVIIRGPGPTECTYMLIPLGSLDSVVFEEKSSLKGALERGRDSNAMRALAVSYKLEKHRE
jgi:hypothetical protein